MEEVPITSITPPHDNPPSSPPTAQPPAAKTQNKSPPFRASLRRLFKSLPNNLQDLSISQVKPAENRTTAGGEIRAISGQVLMNKENAKAIRKASISRVVEGVKRRQSKGMKDSVMQAIALVQYQEAARGAGLGSKWTFIVEDVKAMEEVKVEEKRKWYFE